LVKPNFQHKKILGGFHCRLLLVVSVVSPGLRLSWLESTGEVPGNLQLESTGELETQLGLSDCSTWFYSKRLFHMLLSSHSSYLFWKFKSADESWQTILPIPFSILHITTLTSTTKYYVFYYYILLHQYYVLLHSLILRITTVINTT